MTPEPRPVLYLDNSYTFGGAINALADLLGAVDRARFRPIVLSAQHRSVLDEYFPGTPAEHWAVKLPWVDGAVRPSRRRTISFRGPLRTLANKGRGLRWLLFVDVPEAVRLVRAARRHRARLVHLNNGVEGLAPGLVAAALLRLPVVAHARGPVGTSGMARRYARAVDHWIAVSGTMAENLVDVGVERSRITVVHDAVNLDAFHDGPPPPRLRAELELPAEAPVFGVFGRIIPWKGIREFVLAAREVLRGQPTARALVVGGVSDGSPEYYREMIELSRKLGIADRLLFTGYRRDVADLMRLCSVVVHTSTTPEPFGLTVVEAMATGTPVVAADSGGPSETVVPGKTGLLADPKDTEALAGAIVRLLRDPERAAAMGREGAEHARAHFSPARCARDVEAVYDRLLSPVSRRSGRDATLGKTE